LNTACSNWHSPSVISKERMKRLSMSYSATVTKKGDLKYFKKDIGIGHDWTMINFLIMKGLP
jgi:hypothetical protein